MATALTPAGLQLVAELEGIRRAHDLNSSDIAKICRCKRYTANRYLRGETTIPELTLHVLLTHTGWSENDERYKLLMELREQANMPVWWSSYRLTENMSKLVGFESIASRIRAFEPWYVFGPLQIEDYARAVIRGIDPPGTSPEDIERAVRLRMERQARIYNITNPPELQIILAEAVLRANVGGPRVMADQLEHLAGLTEPLELRILPLNVGAHPGMHGAFHIFEFAPSQRNPAVYVEGQRKSLYLDDQKSLDAASVDFERLWELTWNPAESRGMLLKVAEEARKE